MQPPSKICIHFQRGFCSYGNSCRFSHQQVGAFAQGGGGRFSEARWAQTHGRGGRFGAQYSFYQESYVQVSTSAYHAPVSRPSPVREWSAPVNIADSARQGPCFNFRFMSWNILAAELAHTHAAELYPHAHQSSLAWHRRLAAVVRHVAAQRPDVLCLQEVDDWPTLRNELSELGYDGVHVQRTGGRGDGCATLWLRDRLRLAGAGRSKSGSNRSKTSGGGTGVGSGSGSGCGVHKIRMADHGLKDNVALLVHLLPRRGAAAAATEPAAVAPAPIDAAAGCDRSSNMDMSSSSGSDASGASGTGEEEDAAAAASDLQPPRLPSDGRRPKRSRQSRDDVAAAADAATAGIASLRPYTSPSGGEVSATGAGVSTDTTGRQPEGGGGLRLPKDLRRGFWVANTHVLFNTKRGDIKLGQLRVIMSELAARASSSAATEAADSGGGASTAPAAAGVPVLLAGDFNTAPGSGLYRFLRYGSLQLAGEDRRELSGQLEGYGYSQLQYDTLKGRPPRLSRWAPGPDLRSLGAAGTSATAAVITAPVTATATVVSGGFGAGSYSGSVDQASGSSTEAWTTMMQQQRRSHQTYQSYQPYQGRSYSARWDQEELTYAMGPVAVENAVAAIRDAAAAATTAAADATSEGAGGGTGGVIPCGYGNGGSRSGGSRFRSQQTPLTRVHSFGLGPGRGGGPRLEAPAAAVAAGPTAAQWRAVAEAAVVRHPLRLRSAYASVDEQEREPLFTTLHARYVGTVDFVWYTPGGGQDEEGGDGDRAVAGDAKSSGSKECGFRLTPVRVLQPPDPLSYPQGMPCPDWPSDHVSLVVDFRLS